MIQIIMSGNHFECTANLAVTKFHSFRCSVFVDNLQALTYEQQWSEFDLVIQTQNSFAWAHKIIEEKRLKYCIFSMQHKTESISIFFPSFYIKVFFCTQNWTFECKWMAEKNQRRWIKAIFHFCSSFPLLIGIQTFILIPMHSSACKLFQWN